MHIVLLEPEQAGNAFAIGRTCVATNTPLHLIYPLGFRLHDRKQSRAGLDYWEKVSLHTYIDWADFKEQHPDAELFFATTKADQTYADVHYPKDAYIVFGKESAGIPEEILIGEHKRCVRIPMYGESRSLNLSNSVGIILYEALRQQNFAGLNNEGSLHRLQWES